MFSNADTFRSGFSTYNTSGALTAADSTPAGTLVVNGTDNAATVTITSPATGRYKVSVPLTTLADGDVFYVRVAATIGGVAQEWESQTGRIRQFPTRFSSLAINSTGNATAEDKHDLGRSLPAAGTRGLPISRNLAEVARLIYAGNVDLIVIGDSTFVPSNADRFLLGLLRKLEPRRIRSVLLPAFSAEGTWNGSYLATENAVGPGGTMSDGVTVNNLPVNANQISFGSNLARFAGIVFWKWMDLANNVFGGDPMQDSRMQARLWFLKGSATVNWLEYETIRQGIGATYGEQAVAASFDPSLQPSGHSVMSFTMAAPTATDATEFKLTISAGDSNETGTYLFYNGLEFRALDRTGVGYSVIAKSGASTTTHSGNTFWTTAHLTNHLNMLGGSAPVVFWVQLGINRGTGEGGTTPGIAAHKAELEAIIAKLDAACTAAARDYRVLLVNPWGTSQDLDGWEDARPVALHQVADANWRVSVWDFGGAVKALYGGNLDWGPTYTFDPGTGVYIHPNAAGINMFGTLANGYMLESLAASPGIKTLELRTPTYRLASDTSGNATSNLTAGAISSVQSGLATAAALNVVDDFLDTEIAAIKAKTDQLGFSGGLVLASAQALPTPAPAGYGGSFGAGTVSIDSQEANIE